MNLDETAPQWDLEFVGIAYPDFHAWREENRSLDAMAVFENQALVVTYAAVALVLAVAGIYGIVSYSVNQRSQEISIRMALGASPGQVLSRVMKQGLVLVCLGTTLGLAAAFMAARMLSSLLFGVRPTDWGVYAVVTSLLAGMAFIFPSPVSLLDLRDSRWLQVVGRLRAGVSREGAQSALMALASSLEKEHLISNKGVGVRLAEADRNRVPLVLTRGSRDLPPLLL